MTLAFFLALVEESHAYSVLEEMRTKPQSEVLDHIMSLAPPSRLEELGMTRSRLENWAALALNLKKISSDYDPRYSTLLCISNDK